MPHHIWNQKAPRLPFWESGGRSVSMVPLWKKNPKDVTPEQFNDFYKSKFDDYEDLLYAIPLHIEDTVFYDALIYIPSHVPYNLYSENYEKGLDLYSKGVFIKEKCKELVPDYMKFIPGLVDSDDFSLNISREMLQKSPLVEKIADSIEKKIISTLKENLEKEPKKYRKFFAIYGDHLSMGSIRPTARRRTYCRIYWSIRAF